MKTKEQTQVLIVDDHAIVREGLKAVLGSCDDMQVTGEACSGGDIIRLLRKKAADVLLLEIALPDRNGIDVLKQVRKEHPELPVLVFSYFREDQYAIRALKAGAAGYLHKQAATEELLDALRQVAAGRKYISAALAQELANQVGEDHAGAPHEGLSDREYQTLVMIASGKTVSDIAAELTLSVKTISMYRARLLAKMKMRHNAELTHYAIKNALVE